VPITSTWTTPSSLDRAINDILTETIWDNLVSNELYLWDTLHNFTRQASILSILIGASDCVIARQAADFIYTNDEFASIRAAPGTAPGLTTYVSGDSWQRFRVDGDGTVKWGSGAAIQDVILSRTAANQLSLASGDELVVGGALTASAASANNVPTRLAESVLGADAASISFTSIPSGFRNLQLVLTARGTTAAQNILVQMRFNNDTGNNYDQQAVNADDTTLTGGRNTGVSAIDLFSAPAASATANRFGLVECVIGSYKATDKHKPVVSNAKAANAGTGAIIWRNTSGRWNSTSAINRVDVFPASGNFLAGTTATLIGLP
jgi:hypothetical protein